MMHGELITITHISLTMTHHELWGTDVIGISCHHREMKLYGVTAPWAVKTMFLCQVKDNGRNLYKTNETDIITYN